jgi:hypothetical protein
LAIKTIAFDKLRLTTLFGQPRSLLATTPIAAAANAAGFTTIGIFLKVCFHGFTFYGE